MGQSGGVSRRGLLVAGGVALAGAGALAAGALASAAEPPTSASGTTGLPPSPRFALGAEPRELWRRKPLHNNTVLQSLAFDNVHGHIYTVQLVQGGLQLPGESAPVSGAQRDLRGDLALTKLDLAGNELGHMYLTGFGHGVQIGVQPAAHGAYLWTETKAVADDGVHGWGSVLGRFAFVDGAVLTPDTPGLTQVAPVPGADRTTATIDPAYGTLTMRHRVDGHFRYAMYRLEQLAHGVVQPIAEVAQPDVLATDFQGYATYGRYLYLIEGNAYGHVGSTPPTGNTVITRVRWSDGVVEDRQPCTAAADLAFREPEGMAIQLVGGRPRLAFGFAETISATDSHKIAVVCYLDQLA
ncbi:phage baseplate protein [Actinocatenispora rupis]|uniref:P68 RBP/TagC-like beta-propeller domain-containing protein n=1 Tax=Actinocatenispora rupis TaxID=519421 RepID=A0A8J3IZN4_9ACTN|nr:hypothetical protein [Actinocatenispora rupis]GID13031.1 hypothetical protein Aru02nite_39200 [Actinocatenispora rupis]